MSLPAKSVLLKNVTQPTPIKFSSTQINWRMMSASFELGTRDGLPDAHKGKLLIFYDGCHQYIGAPDDIVTIPDNSSNKNIPKV
jgi:hypothetical protein